MANALHSCVTGGFGLRQSMDPNSLSRLSTRGAQVKRPRGRRTGARSRSYRIEVITALLDCLRAPIKPFVSSLLPLHAIHYRHGHRTAERSHSSASPGMEVLRVLRWLDSIYPGRFWLRMWSR